MRFRIRCDTKTALLAAAAALLALASLGADHARAAGDAAKGKAAFVRQCAILRRKAGTVAGFGYSRAFKATASWDWNADLVAGWIGAPGVMVPGTAMGVFQGVAQRDRDDIVAYLATQQ
jgi:hypothetical protein